MAAEAAAERAGWIAQVAAALAQASHVLERRLAAAQVAGGLVHVAAVSTHAARNLQGRIAAKAAGWLQRAPAGLAKTVYGFRWAAATVVARRLAKSAALSAQALSNAEAALAAVVARWLVESAARRAQAAPYAKRGRAAPVARRLAGRTTLGADASPHVQAALAAPCVAGWLPELPASPADAMFGKAARIHAAVELAATGGSGMAGAGRTAGRTRRGSALEASMRLDVAGAITAHGLKQRIVRRFHRAIGVPSWRVGGLAVATHLPRATAGTRAGVAAEVAAEALPALHQRHGGINPVLRRRPAALDSRSSTQQYRTVYNIRPRHGRFAGGERQYKNQKDRMRSKPGQPHTHTHRPHDSPPVKAKTRYASGTATKLLDIAN